MVALAALASSGAGAATLGELAAALSGEEGVGTSFAIGSERMKKLSKRGSLGYEEAEKASTSATRQLEN